MKEEPRVKSDVAGVGRPNAWLRTACAVALLALGTSALKSDETIALDQFGDGIRHWKNEQGSEDYPIYAASEVAKIADNLRLYQRANGGWPKNFDPRRILTDEEHRELLESRKREDTTFDNRATYPEVVYLARAYTVTGDPCYRDSARRGIEFTLRAQYAHGGWPHSYPSTRGYYPHVTIVDEVMSGLLSTLRRIAGRSAPFEWIDADLQARIVDAVARGDACLLRLQLRVDGQLTVWASQYDSRSLEPAAGRSFELPGLVSSESASVVRYLMSIDPPSDEVRQAVEAAIRWFERSKVSGLRIERVAAEPVRYEKHTSRDDVVAIDDPDAPPLWARFYEIDANRPFMANRDGRKVFRLADVERERRTGYSWYGGYATTLLERDYPAWRKKWAAP